MFSPTDNIVIKKNDDDNGNEYDKDDDDDVNIKKSRNICKRVSLSSQYYSVFMQATAEATAAADSAWLRELQTQLLQRPM